MNVSALLNPVATPQFDKVHKLIDETLDQCRQLSNSIYNDPSTMVVANQGDVWTVEYNTRGSVLEYRLVDGPSAPMCIMSKVKGVSQPIPPGEEEVLLMGVILEGTDAEVMNRVAMAHALHKHHSHRPVRL